MTKQLTRPTISIVSGLLLVGGVQIVVAGRVYDDHEFKSPFESVVVSRNDLRCRSGCGLLGRGRHGSRPGHAHVEHVFECRLVGYGQLGRRRRRRRVGHHHQHRHGLVERTAHYDAKRQRRYKPQHPKPDDRRGQCKHQRLADSQWQFMAHLRRHDPAHGQRRRPHRSCSHPAVAPRQQRQLHVRQQFDALNAKSSNRNSILHHHRPVHDREHHHDLSRRHQHGNQPLYADCDERGHQRRRPRDREARGRHVVLDIWRRSFSFRLFCPCHDQRGTAVRKPGGLGSPIADARERGRGGVSGN